MKITVYQHVRHADVPLFESAGWTVASSIECHHRHYGVLMRAPDGWSVDVADENPGAVGRGCDQ